ncbi:hypothetical protein T281_09305 [Rhodomicrobium udaipurense JA643]|nr:hypothetical protein T281_09305 [Rhodomicrobium udaipurense JA643]
MFFDFYLQFFFDRGEGIGQVFFGFGLGCVATLIWYPNIKSPSLSSSLTSLFENTLPKLRCFWTLISSIV